MFMFSALFDPGHHLAARRRLPSISPTWGIAVVVRKPRREKNLTAFRPHQGDPTFQAMDRIQSLRATDLPPSTAPATFSQTVSPSGGHRKAWTAAKTSTDSLRLFAGSAGRRPQGWVEALAADLHPKPTPGLARECERVEILGWFAHSASDGCANLCAICVQRPRFYECMIRESYEFW